MCGISGIFGNGWHPQQLEAMIGSMHHRGPDDTGRYINPSGTAGLGQNRLSIIDLSSAGHQPMCSADGEVWLTFNGEIYNYLELRAELSDYPFRTQTDSEVILAAWQRWGVDCLDRMIGMFAFFLWDERQRVMFAARDRFGVKPVYYHLAGDGTLMVASEIKALHAAGVPAEPNPTAWANYLGLGLYDHNEITFWNDIDAMPAGHFMTWQDGKINIRRWYDLAERIDSTPDTRPLDVVREEYLALMEDSVKLRFRADVPVGINLSGGLDSSALLALVQRVQGADSDVKAFTFITGDPNYDELPWVQQMLAKTRHPAITCLLQPEDVPALADSVQRHEDEPFGGLPTLAYARLFERARAEGVIVLLDGQGMDEQWAGYDYYEAALNGQVASTVQGTTEKPFKPECLTDDFRALAQPFTAPQPFQNKLLDLQYRDARHTKIPRALRFNDRVSMRASTELREPFLDHRLFELAMRQPAERKIQNGTRKWMLRQIIGDLLPSGVVEAPKRPLQTPQREWLRGPLKGWAEGQIEEALNGFSAGWLKRDTVWATWENFCAGKSDNSFYVWQWISLGLINRIYWKATA